MRNWIHVALSMCVCAATALAGQPLPPVSAPSAATDEAGRADQRVPPGYLGVIADDRRERGRGVRLVEVLPNSPAARAGLSGGDLLTGVDGNAVRSMNDFFSVVAGHPAGDELHVTLQRDGRLLEIAVVLGQRPPPGARRFAQFGRVGRPPPADKATAARPRLLGVLVVPISEDVRRRLDLPDHHGAVVTHVARGSPADRARLPISAAIVAVDHDAVDGPADLARLVAAAGPGNSVILAYRIGERIYECQVTLADLPATPPGIVAPEPVVPDTTSLTPAEEIESLKQRVRELEAIIRRQQELDRLRPP